MAFVLHTSRTLQDTNAPDILPLFFFFFNFWLDLRCCVGFSLVASSRGYSVVTVCRLLIAVASLVAEHRLGGTQASAVVAQGLNSCSSWALKHMLSSCGAWELLCSMWDLLGPWIKLCLLLWWVASFFFKLF